MLVRLTAVLCGLALMAAGIVASAEVAATRGVSQIARLIEEGSGPSAAFLTRNTERFSSGWLANTCLPDRKRALLTIRLAAIDAYVARLRAGALVDFAETDQALAEGIGAAEALLRCTPADGNGWLRFAMVATISEGPGERVVAALQRSFWMAPHEAWVIRTRLPFVARLVNAGAADPALLSILASDAETFARQGRGPEIRAALAEGGNAAGDALEAATSLVSDERRAFVEEILAQSG